MGKIKPTGEIRLSVYQTRLGAPRPAGGGCRVCVGGVCLVDRVRRSLPLSRRFRGLSSGGEADTVSPVLSSLFPCAGAVKLDRAVGWVWTRQPPGMYDNRLMFARMLATARGVCHRAVRLKGVRT